MTTSIFSHPKCGKICIKFVKAYGKRVLWGECMCMCVLVTRYPVYATGQIRHAILLKNFNAFRLYQIVVSSSYVRWLMATVWLSENKGGDMIGHLFNYFNLSFAVYSRWLWSIRSCFYSRICQKSKIQALVIVMC